MKLTESNLQKMCQLAFGSKEGFSPFEQLSSAAVFLASDDASWITGQVLVVDGGHAFNI